jgi:hypothetical protein
MDRLPCISRTQYNLILLFTPAILLALAQFLIHKFSLIHSIRVMD